MMRHRQTYEVNKPPENSKFKQQKLPAWQPILTAGTVLPAFFVIGVIFIPLGVALLLSSNAVNENIIDYTDCTMVGDSTKKCSDIIEADPNAKCNCRLRFNITSDWQGQVYMYYGLVDFYQNHRRYVRSRDDTQLDGKPRDASTDCDPFQKNGTGLSYAPCGAIANSLFNDSLTITKIATANGDVDVVVPLLKKGIAWPTDREKKFQNPSAAKSCGSYQDNATCWENAFKDTQQPPYWSKAVYQLDETDASNNGFENEDLIVWMRTAALPTFRKLYRKIAKEGIFKDQFPAGMYKLLVEYKYPVSKFGGRKRVILSTTSWLGSKNPFLGVAYIVVGSLCILLGIVFLVIHIKFGKSLVDMADVRRS